MCGRYALARDLDFYADYYAVDEVAAEAIEPSWNVAPTDQVYVVTAPEEGRRLSRMAWGLVPHWAEDRRAMHINARVESAAAKPPFRSALGRHRCLVPADGFYEWEPAERGRVPHWVFRADGHPLTFAGIWAGWKDPGTGEWERRVAILTIRAEGPVAAVHDRMPVILAEPAWEAWLDRSLDDPEAALDLIETVPPDLLMEHGVSTRVNNVAHNGPDLVEPGSGRLF